MLEQGVNMFEGNNKDTRTTSLDMVMVSWLLVLDIISIFYCFYC